MRPFLIFLLATIINYSCSSDSYKNHPNKLDTFPVAVFRVILPDHSLSRVYYDTAIYQIVSKWVFEDTLHSKGGAWRTDTFRYGRIVTDTARDAAHKPLFDSLKRPIWAIVWYPIPRGFVEPSHIPMTLPDSLLHPKPKKNPNAPQTKIEKPSPDTTKH